MQQTLNDTAHIEEPQEKPNFFTETKSLVQSYIDDRITLLKLQIAERVSVITASVISGVILTVLGLFFLISFTIALGFLFAHWMHSNAKGFGIVTAIYLLLILIVVFFGKRLFGNAITQKIIQGFFKKK